MTQGNKPSRRQFVGMPSLIRFLLVNAAAGFGLGFVVGCAFVQARHGLDFFVAKPLASAMIIWSFGAGFAMGMIGSALALISDDSRDS